MPLRNLRDCKSFERRWRDRCVDANLEDNWLERLNDNLQSFKLISICEGHETRLHNEQTLGNRVSNTRQVTHINLRLNVTFIDALSDNWDSYKTRYQQAIESNFSFVNTDCSFKLKFELGFRNSEPFQKKDIVFSLRMKQNPRNADNRLSKNQWFSETINAIEIFDVFVLESLKTEKN